MRFFRERVRSILQLNDRPHKIALAAAVGAFVAFTPTLGLHTISCLLLAWALRVSKFVALTTSLVMNPWTMVPLYSFCLWLGIRLTGAEIAVPEIAWNELTITGFISVIRPYLWPFVAGTMTVSALSAVLVYAVIYRVVVRRRARA